MARPQDLENVLWAWLKRAAKKFPPGSLHARRVENSVGIGDPDVEGCLESRAFNVELKVAEVRADGTLAIRHYTAEQAHFAHSRTRAGGRSLLLIRVGHHDEGSRHYLIDGRHALDVHDRREHLDEDYLRSLSEVDPKAPPAIVWRKSADPAMAGPFTTSN